MDFKIAEAKKVILYMLNNKEYQREVKLVQLEGHIQLVGLSIVDFENITEKKKNTNLSLLVTTANGILLVQAHYESENPEAMSVCLCDLVVLQKTQRRRYARIPFLGDVVYLPIKETALLHINEESMQKTVLSMGTRVYCVDISASGLSINTPEALPDNILLGMTIFNLNDIPPLFVYGRVTHHRRFNDCYLVGIDLSPNIPRKRNIIEREFVKVQRKYLQLISRER